MHTKQTVLNYWNNPSFKVNPYYKAFAGPIAELANLFVTQYPKIKGSDQLEIALSNMGTPKDNELKQALANQLVEELEFYFGGTFAVPGAVQSLSFTPAGPSIPAAPPLSSGPDPATVKARNAIKALRTTRSRKRGLLLAQAARSLNGSFSWVQRSPANLNGFVNWVRSPRRPLPSRNLALSCWESVLVTAIAANLLTRDKLCVSYREFTDSADKQVGSSFHTLRHSPRPDQKTADVINAGCDAYVMALDRLLFFSKEAVPVDYDKGLIPQAGDLVYIVGGPAFNHVAISLGRTWASGSPEDLAMSLSNDNGGKFSTVDIDTFGSGDSVRFRPCPF